MFSGQVDALAEKLPAVTWARADFARVSEFKAIFGVEAAPTLLLVRERVGLYAGPATFPAAQFEALVRRALAFDMDDGRRDMQAQRLAESGLATHLVAPLPDVGACGLPDAALR